MFGYIRILPNQLGKTWKHLCDYPIFRGNTKVSLLYQFRGLKKNDFFGSFVILSFVQDGECCRLQASQGFPVTVCSQYFFSMRKTHENTSPCRWFSPCDRTFIPRRWRSKPFKRSPQPYPQKRSQAELPGPKCFVIHWHVRLLNMDSPRDFCLSKIQICTGWTTSLSDWSAGVFAPGCWPSPWNVLD